MLCMFLSTAGFSQGPEKGTILFQGSFAAGLDLVEKDTRFYVWGDLGYMVTDQIGVNGAILFQAGSNIPEFPQILLPGSARDRDLRTHYLLFGPEWHFRPGKPLDVYASFQPGLALSHIPDHLDPVFGVREEMNMLSPVASVNGGIAYYGSIFHVFASTRIVAGGSSNVFYQVRIAEIMPSFGLGFNINTR